MTPDEREIAEAEAELELDAIGYAGDAKTYRLRLDKMAEQALRDVGPLAQHRRRLAHYGHRPRMRWPRLTTAWNEEPTPAWKAALMKDGKR